MTAPGADAALLELQEIGREVDGAVARILDAAEQGLHALSAETPALEEARAALRTLLETAGFGDLVAQRLASCRRALTGAAETRPDAHLLAGPTSAGLDQDAADRLFAAP